MRLAAHFIPWNMDKPSFMIGALLAVGSREHRYWRWVSVGRRADMAVLRGHMDGLTLIERHGRRIAKRMLVRLSRYERMADRWSRDRRDHVDGLAQEMLRLDFQRAT